MKLAIQFKCVFNVNLNSVTYSQRLKSHLLNSPKFLVNHFKLLYCKDRENLNMTKTFII